MCLYQQNHVCDRVMSGYKNCVRVKIQSKYPFAIYTELNLVVLDLYKKILHFLKQIIKIN
jgi:hypothetical protein